MTQPVSVAERVWRVFYVRPRTEKKTATELAETEVEIFLPVRKAVKQWSDRKKTVEEPLFGGYVFAHVNERERLDVLTHASVIRSVGFGGTISQVSVEEIEQLKLLQMSPVALEAMTMKAFPTGTEVFVQKGPLTGVRGYVSGHPKKLYLTVEVPSIRQSLRVQIPADWVMRVD